MERPRAKKIDWSVSERGANPQHEIISRRVGTVSMDRRTGHEEQLPASCTVARRRLIIGSDKCIMHAAARLHSAVMT